MDSDKTKAIEWVKFMVGAILFAGLIYVHAYVKELSIFILAIPGLLMGIDPSKMFGNKK